MHTLQRLAGQRSTRILSGAGTIAANSTRSTLAKGGRREDLDQVQAMSGKSGGGKIDGLMIGIYETTGEKLPITDHDALSAHLQAELRQLSTEKGHGETAYASTAAFHSVLFDIRTNW